MRSRDSSGFTMVELMCASGVLLMGLLGIFTILTMADRRAVWAVANEAATDWACRDVGEVSVTNYVAVVSLSSNVLLYAPTDFAQKRGRCVEGKLERVVREDPLGFKYVRSSVVWNWEGARTNVVETFVFQ